MTRFYPFRVTALLLAAASPLPAVAQGGPLIQPMTPNADRLSEVMRTLGRSPNDLSALIEAGRLSGRLGDFDAAMQLLARAERVSPTDPRIAAARAATLVGMERPGQALALFATAERAGLPMGDYAADRGLAYDLLGYSANAQRDYRLALAQGADDEVTRRLALSMGIEGDVTGATALLDPLLRRNDRAAWRVRACVLAMSGDAAGADRIAASMLPGFGPSLAPFFRRLPQLSAADRAFAVHFGRLAPTPERIADARLAPQVIPVPREAPVAVAAATPAPAAAVAPQTRRAPTYAERRAEQRRQAETARQAQLAETKRAADARAAQLAKAQADEQARRTALAQAQSAEAQRVRDAQQLAARQAEQARLAEATRIEGERVAARQAEERRVAAAALAERDRVAAAQTPVVPASATPAPTQIAAADIAPTPAPVAATPAPGFTPDTAVPAASTAAATVAARAPTNDDVLARIIRNLDVPASELGVAPPTPAPTLPDAATQAAAAQAAREAAVAREAEDRAAEARRVATAKALADKKAADARKLADAKKAAEAKRVADAKKAEEAAEAKRLAAIAKADPERHWVQVAGGANVADLPKAWKALAAKTPALKGKQAWTTPLRFTNRLLAGPFKTDEEAQAFVNTLGKSGLSAFAFTSPKGQKVTKVPTS